MLTVLIFPNILFAQFVRVQDEDGFCNIRKSPKVPDKQSENNIITKLYNGHILYCLPDGNKDNWLDVDFEKNNVFMSGYIYKNRVRFITSYPKVEQIYKSNSLVKLRRENIEIIVSKEKFDKTTANLTFDEKQKWLKKINGKKIYGTDGNIPQYQYATIVVRFGDTRLSLPKEAFANLYEPNLYKTQANYDEKNKTLYIQSMNSDGAGGYLVLWKVVNGEYKDRLIVHGF